MPGPLRQNLLTVFLVTGALGLGAHQYDNFTVPAKLPVATFSATGTAMAEQPAETITTYALPMIGNYAEVVSRPLFTPTRRPPVPRPAPKPRQVVAPALVPPKIETGQFMLIGVIVDGDKKVALMRQLNRGDIVRATRGEQLDAWKVTEIGTGSVILSQGGVKEVVLLRDNVMSEVEKRKLQRARKDVRNKKANGLPNRRAIKRNDAPKRAVTRGPVKQNPVPVRLKPRKRQTPANARGQ